MNKWLILRSNCSESDREECVPLITYIASLSEKARREGLLSIEEDLENLQVDSYSAFFRQGLQLVVDGTDPEIVRTILEQTMFTSGCKGKELLKLLLIAEGCLYIQTGINPRLMKEILCSLLGVNGYKMFTEIYTEFDDENFEDEES